MKELAYHVLDIANNSVRGKASNIKIMVDENIIDNQLIISIEDDGVGIPPEILKSIKDPFTTSRTMRKVGLGIPFLNDTCVFCNGGLEIESHLGSGTRVRAWMEYAHIDRPPLGNIVSSVTTLITSEEAINIQYEHIINGKKFSVSTKELKAILGQVPLNQVEVVLWLKEYIKENIEELKK